MCGRFALDADDALLATTFGVSRVLGGALHSKWNLAPGSNVAVVRRARDGVIERAWSWWGFRHEGDLRPLFNARAETVRQLPTFREAFARRRCLVPASGWYEWKRDQYGGKVPFYFTGEPGHLLALAGLWTMSGDGTEACAVITCAPNHVVRPVHDRMPVVLGRRAAEAWMDPRAPLDALKDLLRPCPDGWLRSWAVGNDVGNRRNDDATLIEPRR